MSDQETFRVILRFEIKEGVEAEFERTWLDIADVITGHPANRGQWLLRGTQPGAPVYFVISDWTSEPEFRAFERSDDHLEHRVKLHPFRTGGSMETTTVVHAPQAAGASR
ncbi:Heme-degrading monooxygenase HmoA [Amycolatopsis tolypomycina]|uniref:Heme-degrading monooxygenase HmoA n=1 Tax=Amycolatopsis tolypomycina TaxID=208445 RepID=A0A1H4TXP4_9PSEU|nr:antibiotic biosynthesis monooxygenase family protein [Amycolatopsis tolypomycina]SEC60831.1 Heme-degrading monooxygenase HmoA [Amycolatopsis tolypomycina]